MPAASSQYILAPLAEFGVGPAYAGNVAFSHHQSDPPLNAALFDRDGFHDFWAI